MARSEAWTNRQCGDRGPRQRAGLPGPARRALVELAARARDHVVEVVPPPVLEVVLVAVEQQPGPAAAVQRDEPVDLGLHVGVVRPRAPHRVVAERDAPHDVGAGSVEGALQPGPVLRVVEPVRPPLGAPGGVDAHELQQRTQLQPVEQARPERRPAGLGPGREPRRQVQVVLQLDPVVGRLLVGPVVVAGRGIERQVVDQVAVRLEVGEPPVVVVGAAVLGRAPGTVVDRVAERDHEPDVEGVGQPLHRAGHAELAPAVLPGVDADAHVAEGEERDGVRLVGAGVGAQPEVEGPRRGPQPAGRPVVAVGRVPRHAVDHHPVAVGGGGGQALHPDVVRVVDDLPGHHVAVAVQHLDRGPAHRRRPRAERLAGAAGPPAPVLRAEDEAAPGHQGRRRRDVDELDVRLEPGPHGRSLCRCQAEARPMRSAKLPE